MNYVYDLLEKRGYNVNKNYYSMIEDWIAIWKGKAEWLDLQTIDNKRFDMYSLGMAKKSCEDLASVITSEPFTIKASSNDKILKKDLDNAKVLRKLPKEIEALAYTGTIASVARIVDADMVGEDENARLRKNAKTKIKTISLKANQIIPLTIIDDEIINCAFVSEQTRKIGDKLVKIYYVEIHELEEKGYKITNIYINADNGKEIEVEGVVPEYNTMSNVPLFSIAKLPKENVYDENNGLGMSLFADSVDQLKILDLTYNNFGADFKLGQKIMVINKKLTQLVNETYIDKDGKQKTRARVVYPTEVQKQLFKEVGTGIADANQGQSPYVYEYNPDLRVGDNKEGVQFALDNYSFKIGFGTKYYSFEGNNVATATEATYSRQDFVANGNKVRRAINEYLVGICRALLVCERMLGVNVKPEGKIEVAEVDGFLEDDNTIRERLNSDVASGYITKKRYLMKVYGMTEEEALKELAEIEAENDITNVSLEDEDKEE